jgi:hypothetical protein
MTVPYEELARKDGAGGVPILAMAKELDAGGLLEIVHSDLNAIVQRKAVAAGVENGRPRSFREFSVFFHDELKTFYTRNFSELGKFGEGQLAGVRDGFAINYGSSGMGAALLANRKCIGPAANCAECLYEEFFLTSWANGDPALLEQYSDDPSNVHHSYLNDPIVFRNFHAGPKETHVFHLHAHQWFSETTRTEGPISIPRQWRHNRALPTTSMAEACRSTAAARKAKRAGTKRSAPATATGRSAIPSSIATSTPLRAGHVGAVAGA